MASIQTEEACKNAFVMPFLGALGYDVFNPDEVVPEFVADVGVKKGEKVDYAIRKDGKIIMLVECKWNGKALSLENASQLFRYFTVTDARFAILTNGLVFQFHTDIDEPNKMDRHPFFVFNLLDFTEAHVDELKKFSKQAFDIDNVLGTATALKYTNQVKAILTEELSSPSDEFVKIFASRIYEGRMTQAIREQFSTIVQRSFTEFVRERVSDRLKTALRADDAISADVSDGIPVGEDEGVVTTEEETEAFNIVRAIARQAVKSGRITMRDAKAYCAILLDDNNRKPIARLHFNGKAKKYIGLFSGKTEEKFEVGTLDDIFSFAPQILATLAGYETK